MKQLIGALLVASFVFFIGFMLFRAFDFEKRKYQYDASWVRVVATLTQCGQSKTRSKMSYTYNGVSYNQIPGYYSIGLPGCEPGDKYYIFLNPRDPARYIPVDWQPVFTDDESRVATTGLIKAICRKHALDRWSLYSDYYAIFTYAVDSRQYDKAQVLPPDYQKKFPAIKEGASFEVIYSPDNNGRAVMLFDSTLR